MAKKPPYGQLEQTINKLKKDCAEYTRVEEALRKSEEEKAAILDSLVEHVIHEDTDMKIKWANRAACESAGMTREDLLGRYCYEVWPKRSDPCPDCPVRDAMNTGQPQEIEKSTPDGRAWYIRGYPVRDAHGEIVGGTELTLEITERKRLEETLKQREERYRTILEGIEEGYFEVDLAGNLTFFNNALCAITGYTHDELMGMNNREYTTQETAEEMYQTFNRVYRSGKPLRMLDYEIMVKDGRRMVVEMSISLMRDPSGAPRGFRGVLRDITERKRAEEEQRNLETQFQYAQKMEALGNLAGGIAHNFNNLLMGIMGNISLLQLETESESQKYERLRKIEKLIDSGSLLTKQLLGYAREGRYEITPININRIVRETSDTFAMTKKNIRVLQELGEGIHAVRADQGQIEQVLWNLYVNAGDAMPNGGELFLRTMNMTDKEMTGKPYDLKAGNYVVMTVRDTGVGMDEKTMDRIFEPFFTTKGLSKGTGLGLASVYGMVKAHGGYIDVDSAKGKGTTFSIYLPASGEDVPEKGAPPETIEEGTETILIVDDEQMVLEVNQVMLETIGYTVFVAKGGKEAIALYKENKEVISLVILDMIMPDMSGRETYDRIKAINPDVKILLSSGYSIDGEAEEILKRGCDGFIQKPFDLKEVSHKVREIVDKK